MENKECSVCLLNFTALRRRAMQCPKCEYECCIGCLKQHCLTNDSEPKCININCSYIYTIDYLNSILPFHWLNAQYKVKHKNSLFMRDKNHFNRAIKEIELNKQKEMNNTYNKIIIYITNITNRCSKYIKDSDNKSKDNKSKDNKSKDKCENKQQLDDIVTINTIGLNIADICYKSTIKLADEKDDIISNFIKKCPSNDCTGYLNNQHICTQCRKVVCMECLNIKEDDHKCLESDLKTAKLLMKDTKPCPKCYTLIYKINGCDHMWCPQCHCKFSWDTNKITNGRTSNPHYYEYQRKIKKEEREIGDIQCGGSPSQNLIVDNIRKYVKNSSNSSDDFNLYCKYFCDISPFLVYIREEKIKELIDPFEYQSLCKYRIEYLNNKITEDKYIDLIYRAEKTYYRNKEINDIYNTCVLLFEDILRLIVSENVKNMIDVDNIIKDIKDLVKFINKCFNDVALKNKIVCPNIEKYELKDFILKKHYYRKYFQIKYKQVTKLTKK